MSTSARAREVFSGVVEGTPGRMRVLGAIAIVVSLAFGVFGFLALLRFSSDLDEAGRNAEQLVRIQSIRTNLVKADANATNAFLVGGLEPPAVRDAYTNGITSTAKTLAAASAARADDAAALERVNRVLTEYTGLIEAARARTTARGSQSARPTFGRRRASCATTRCPRSPRWCRWSSAGSRTRPTRQTVPGMRCSCSSSWPWWH